MKPYRYIVQLICESDTPGRLEKVYVSYHNSLPGARDWAMMTARDFDGVVYAEEQDGYRQIASFVTRKGLDFVESRTS